MAFSKTYRWLVGMAFLAAMTVSAGVARAGQAEDLYALSLTTNPQRAETFVAALKSPDLAVRRAAASGLVFAATPEILPAIQTALAEEKSTFVRRALIEAASRVNTPQAKAILESALKDSYEINRLAAAERLLRLGDHPEAVACVLKALDSDTRESVLMACEISGTFTLKQAAAQLNKIALAEDNGGENSRDTFALRALDLIGRAYPETQPLALSAARSKAKTISSFMRVEIARILGEFGDTSDLPTLHGWLSGQWVEVQFPVALGLARIKDPSSATVLVDTLNESGRKDRMRNPDFFMLTREYIRAVAAIGNSAAVAGLREFANSLPAELEGITPFTPGKIVITHLLLRVNVAYALWVLGDAPAEAELAAFLQHEDAAVRREAAKCIGRLKGPLSDDLMGALVRAERMETEPYTYKVMYSVASDKGLRQPAPALAAAPTSQPASAVADNAPRYLLINYDDCATISAMDRILDLSERYAAAGSRLVARLMVAPGSRFDEDYLAIILKRLYDRGSEIGNHTFYHNNDGWDYYRLSEHELEAEYRLCNDWLHAYIPGLKSVYAFWPGGSGFRPPGKKPISRKDLTNLAIAGWGLAKTPQSPRGGSHENYFPPDFCAPPYHEPDRYISCYEAGDLSASHMFDSAEEGLEAFKASFERFYANPEGTVYFSFRHDWPLGTQEIRPGTKYTYGVFGGLLEWILAEQKTRFPNVRCISPIERSFMRAGLGKELDPAKGNLQNR